MSRLTSWMCEPDIIIIAEPLVHYSKRYDKTTTVPGGFACDGATMAPNVGNGYKHHDWLFFYGKWDDGTRCTFVQANMVIYDVMRDEGRWIGARAFLIGVFLPPSKHAWKAHRASEIRKINHRQFQHVI